MSTGHSPLNIKCLANLNFYCKIMNCKPNKSLYATLCKNYRFCSALIVKLFWNNLLEMLKKEMK